MSKKKKAVELTINLPPGRKRKHGGHTFLMTGRLSEHRKYIEGYLTAARIGLIQDYGPTEKDLSTAQIIIIDRMIAKTGCIRCMEEHCAENGVMLGRRLAPALRESYLSYSNSLRLDALALEALRIDKKRERVDLGKYIEMRDEEKAKAKAAAKAGTKAQADQADRQGGEGDVRDQVPNPAAIEAPGSSSSDIPKVED